MPSYLHPGVYVEEIPSKSRPIEGVATCVAAFVGPAVRGPAGEAELVHSFDEYEAIYGAVASEKDEMGLAVSAFLVNGGKDVYIGRVVGEDPPAAAAEKTVVGEDTNGAVVLKISASSVGTWGDEVYFRIVKPEAESLKFKLEVGHVKGAKFLLDEEFSDLSMDETDDNYVLTRVSRESRLVEVSLEEAADPESGASLYQEGSWTGEAVPGAASFFEDNIVDDMTITVNVDGLGYKRIHLGAAGDLNLEGTNVQDGPKVATAIESAVQAVGPAVQAYAEFGCEYSDDREFVLTSGSVNSSSSVVVRKGNGSETDLATFLKLAPDSEVSSVHGAARVVPAETLGLPDPGVGLSGGESADPEESDYGDFFNEVLVKKREVSIITLPGQTMAKDGSGNSAVTQALAHCNAVRNRILIVDPPPDCELKDSDAVDGLSLPTSTYAVLYYPWVEISNPFYNVDTNPNASKKLEVAPSSFAAGLWSAIDSRRGVWKAPAGVETQLAGATGLQFEVTDGVQNYLNPKGVNCYRQIPGYGRVVWGSRTLATKMAPEWRYVPVRRTAIYIEQSIYNGIQWSVFEGNNHLLWSALRLNIEGFMNGLFRSGAFQGKTANQAYFVRCGLGDTMTQNDIDVGQVIVIVGFAPLKPAEFVIVRIQQKIGDQ